MFCSNCGKEIEDNWKVCPNCGAEMKSVNARQEGASCDYDPTAGQMMGAAPITEKLKNYHNLQRWKRLTIGMILNMETHGICAILQKMSL